MTSTHGPPPATKSELEMQGRAPDFFGLGKTAAGRYNFVDKIGNAGAFTTQVHGRGALMANAG